MLNHWPEEQHGGQTAARHRMEYPNGVASSKKDVSRIRVPYSSGVCRLIYAAVVSLMHGRMFFNRSGLALLLGYPWPCCRSASYTGYIRT